MTSDTSLAGIRDVEQADQPIRPVRVTTSVLMLVAAASLLGVPDRPTLPVGAVDTAAMSEFVVASLRLFICVSIWYLLVSLIIVGLAAIPGPARVMRPLAHRLLSVGVGVLLRRTFASSLAVGVALPSAAAAQTSDPGADEIPVMTPIDGDELDAPREASLSDAQIARPTVAAERTAPAIVDPDQDPPEMHRQPPPRSPTIDRNGPGRRPQGSGNSTSSAQEAPAAAPDPTTGIGAGTAANASPDPTRTDGPTMRQRPGSMAPTDSAGPTEDHGADGRQLTTTPDRTGRQPTETRHTVTAGESFWTIAEGMANGRSGSADTHAVAAVWQQLVDLNAGDLVDPGNPDLLHTGQVIDVSILS